METLQEMEKHFHLLISHRMVTRFKGQVYAGNDDMFGGPDEIANDCKYNTAVPNKLQFHSPQ